VVAGFDLLLHHGRFIQDILLVIAIVVVSLLESDQRSKGRWRRFDPLPLAFDETFPIVAACIACSA
jgi:hypothetical protein